MDASHLHTEPARLFRINDRDSQSQKVGEMGFSSKPCAWGVSNHLFGARVSAFAAYLDHDPIAVFPSGVGLFAVGLSVVVRP
jgi:hypothetical protein